MHPKRSAINANLSRRGALQLVSALGAQALTARVAKGDTASDLKGAEAKLAEAEAQLGAIADEYEELSKLQSNTLDELHDVGVSIGAITENIDRIGKRLAEKQGKLSRSVSEEYKDGSRGVVDLMLASTSVEDFISGLYYYEKVTEEQANLIQDVKDERASLEMQHEQLTKKQAELEEASKAQSEQLEAMRDKQLEAQQLIDGLDKEVRDLVAKRDSELLAAQQEAAKARKDRELAKTASGSNGTGTSGKSGGTSTGTAGTSGTSAPTSATAPSTQRVSTGVVSSTPDAASQDATTQEDEPQDEVPVGTTESTAPSTVVETASTATDAPEPEAEVVVPEPVPEPDPEPEPVAEEEAEPEAPAEEAPSEAAASGSAAAVIAACYSTPSPGGGLCAAWCSNVLMNAGFGFVSGNANDMYAEYCYSSDRGDLRPGMAVAVSTHPHTSAGRIYGHIGMYVGDGTVMDNIGYIRSISLDEWISYYGETVPVRWGWLGGYVLD